MAICPNCPNCKRNSKDSPQIIKTTEHKYYHHTCSYCKERFTTIKINTNPYGVPTELKGVNKTLDGKPTNYFYYKATEVERCPYCNGYIYDGAVAEHSIHCAGQQ